jgi:DNA-binding response OmpR family regulator
MRLESLLVSRDRELAKTLQPALERFTVGMEVCVGPNAGREILNSERFDAVIVDCDDLQGGLDLLKQARGGTANRSSVALAVLNGKTTTRQAFDLGASFVLQKPVTLVNAVRCASAAVSMMARERRRYYRHPIDMSVTLYFGEDCRLDTKATNVSDGGLAVELKEPLPKRSLSLVKFTPPGMATTMELKAEVAWADEKGRAGIRFVGVPKRTREQLEVWLAENFAAKFPELSVIAERGPAQSTPASGAASPKSSHAAPAGGKAPASRVVATKPLRARA